MKWPPDIGIAPYYCDKYRVIYKGDCREILPKFQAAIFSAVVTDPPYLIGFMGKAWDSTGVSFSPATWSIIRGSCKPGAPLLSFGGTRTQHRIACAIEDAGWMLKDVLMWVFATGFPKSLSISKTIDKAMGAEREVVGSKVGQPGYSLKHQGAGGVLAGRADGSLDNSEGECAVTVPATPEAKLWDGWGSSLKPAYEPVLLCMNPVDKTFANNALVHGVAGLNIDGCRIAYQSDADKAQATPQGECTSKETAAIGAEPDAGRCMTRVGFIRPELKGRFPADFIHDGSDEVLELFPQSKGQQGDVRGSEPSHTGGTNTVCYGEYNRVGFSKRPDGSGSAARFFQSCEQDKLCSQRDQPHRLFYHSKASRSERDNGCAGMEGKSGHNRFDTCATCGGYILQNPDRPSACKCEKPVRVHNAVRGNSHPTVKPLALMMYLCKLVKMPSYNLILDPFCGSGTTLLACGSLGIRSIGIDSDESSCEIAAHRCAADSIARIKRGEY